MEMHRRKRTTGRGSSLVGQRRLGEYCFLSIYSSCPGTDNNADDADDADDSDDDGGGGGDDDDDDDDDDDEEVKNYTSDLDEMPFAIGSF